MYWQGPHLKTTWNKFVYIRDFKPWSRKVDKNSFPIGRREFPVEIGVSVNNYDWHYLQNKNYEYMDTLALDFNIISKHKFVNNRKYKRKNSGN